ncbi:MAG: protein BatD [Holophagae bacterium]|nr:protein BatD [Holophagae bacterium]
MAKFLLPILLILAIPIRATEVTATVSANPVGTEDTFQLIIQVESFDGEVKFPRSFSMPDFDIIAGPSTSSSTQIINWKVSRSIKQIFTLSSHKPGSFVIPPFKVMVGAKEYRTQAISVTVKKGSLLSHQQSRPQSPSGMFSDDFFNPPATVRQPVTANSLFIRCELSKPVAYVGEAVVASYRIYSRTSIARLGIREVPDFTGFLTEDLKMNHFLDRKQMTVDGVSYGTAVIFRKIVFPTKTGRLPLPRPVFSIEMGNPSLFYRGEPVMRKSQPATLTVYPLPRPEPDGFSGAVGRFQLSVSFNQNRVKMGDSITGTVTVSGEGDFNTVPLMFPDNIDGFRMFRPSSPELKRVPENPLRGEKTWEIVLVPQKTGALVVPGSRMTFFNPVSKEYVTRQSSPIEISVEEGSASAISVMPGTGGSEVVAVGNDIDYIRTGNAPRRFMDISESRWYRISIVAFPFVFIFLGLFLRWRDPSRRDPATFRRTHAAALFRNRIRQAAKSLKKGRGREYYQQISKACISYFADKWNRPVLDLKIDEIGKDLESKNVVPELIRAIVDVVEYCDFESYTPSSNALNRDIMKDAEAAVAKLEKVL